MSQSVMARLAEKLGPKELVKRLSEEERGQVLYLWRAWARPEQLPPPGNWRTFAYIGGRGAGKTRAGVEWCHDIAKRFPGARIGLIGATAGDARDILVEGESGILNTAAPGFRPRFRPSKRRLIWPNGSIATVYSADKPDRLRGKQHTHLLADELASWKYDDAWDQAMFGLRLGRDPKVMVTTTPRPIPRIKKLLKDPTTVLSRGTTFDNRANLAEPFLTQIIARYEGTRLGRQELYAELIEDAAGALWKRDIIERTRVQSPPPGGYLRTVVAIDPAVSAGEGSDETGIIVASTGMCTCKGSTPERHLFFHEDLSGRYSPFEWATKAIGAYNRFAADRIVGETNNGGDLVEMNIRTVDKYASFRAVHASRGKATRAEPIAALFEKGTAHIVGTLPMLEDQCCTWDPATDRRSPDRVDAAVWAGHELMVGPQVAVNSGTGGGARRC